MIGESLCDLETPSWALGTLLRTIYLMKLEWLITAVIAVWSPVRAEHVFWVISGIFQPFQVALVVGEPLCDMEIPC